MSIPIGTLLMFLIGPILIGTAFVLAVNFCHRKEQERLNEMFNQKRKDSKL